MQYVWNIVVLAVLATAASGCATYGGGNKEAAVAHAATKSPDCKAAPNERAYRNAFLRSRRIGEAACAE